VLLAIACGAGFVARGFTGHKEQLISLMKQAIEYKGYALIDILQPCISFNKTNTFAWYNERVYELDGTYDAKSKVDAMQKAMEFNEKIPLGILYREEKSTYHQKNMVLRQGTPLLDRHTDPALMNRLIASYI